MLCIFTNPNESPSDSGSTFLWILRRYDLGHKRLVRRYIAVSFWNKGPSICNSNPFRTVYGCFTNRYIHGHIQATNNHRDYILYIKLTTDLTRPTIVIIYPLHLSFLRYIICIMYILVSPWYRSTFYLKQNFCRIFQHRRHKWRTDILFTCSHIELFISKAELLVIERVSICSEHGHTRYHNLVYSNLSLHSVSSASTNLLLIITRIMYLWKIWIWVNNKNK